MGVPRGVPGRSVNPPRSRSVGVILAAIVATPADLYVNVPNAPFPAGAIRGQLH
jgi:hypothetical protein